MSESNQIDINSLHNTVLRETENENLLEIKPNFYRNLSDFIGNLRKILVPRRGRRTLCISI